MIYVFARRFVVSPWLGAGIVLALLLGSALAGHCAADSNPPGQQAPDLTGMSIEDLMNLTVVTAGKKPEALSETAAAVFVISRDDIEHYGYRTLAQALRRISGFYSETDRYIDFIGLRGYLPNGDLNRRVLVLVDGHKCNDYLYGQAPVDQDLPVDIRDIERIEVVKGPGSALWGSEALLCTINCITRKASDIAGFQIRQDLGWQEGQSLTYGRSLPGDVEISGSIEKVQSAGQQRMYFAEFDSPENNNGVSVGLDGFRAWNGYMDMSHKGFRLFADHVARWKDVPTAFWGSTFNGTPIDIKDERSLCEMSYENPTPYAGDGKLFCRVYADSYDATCNWPWTSTDVDPPAVIDDRGIDLSRSLGAEVRYSRNMSPGMSMILGTEYLRTYLTHRVNYDLDPYYVYMDRTGDYTMLSYYMQTDWAATRALRFVAGTRFDDHSIFGGNWSPRVDMIYQASPKSTLKLLYGEALRAPSISESHTGDNPYHLNAEKIRTSELVWDLQIGGNGRLVTSLFEYNMHGLIQSVHGIPTNVGKITSSGIESQYEYRLRNGGSGYFGLSLVKAKSGDPSAKLPSSPQCVITCGMCMPVFGNKAYLAPDVQYVSQSWTNLGNVAGAHAIADLTLTSHSLVKGSDVSIGITNLFNVPYYANAQPQNTQDVLAQGERTLLLQATRHM